MQRFLKHVACSFAVITCATSAAAGEAVVVAEPSPPNHPQQPQLAIDVAGVVHVAFAANDEVRYAAVLTTTAKAFQSPFLLALCLCYRSACGGDRESPSAAMRSAFL